MHLAHVHQHFGLTLEQNELLGYHVVKGHSSALNYSRDALSHPIRAMMAMLDGIQRGTFLPLAVRGSQFVNVSDAMSARSQFEKSTGYSLEEAGRTFFGDSLLASFPGLDEFDARMSLLNESKFNSLDTPCATPQVNVHLPQDDSEDDDDDDDGDDDDDDDEDASSSDSCSTPAEEGMAAVEERVLGRNTYGLNSHADVDRMYRHVRTKMLHCAHVDDMHKTCCGRTVSDTFSIFRKDPEFAWPKCRIFFGK